MDKTEMLKQIQRYNFSAYDMLLYLDTHPKDKKAFSMFRQLVEKTNKLKREYEKEHGPLTAFNAAKFDEFTWLDSPWPWEKGDNA